MPLTNRSLRPRPGFAAACMAGLMMAACVGLAAAPAQAEEPAGAQQANDNVSQELQRMRAEMAALRAELNQAKAQVEALQQREDADAETGALVKPVKPAERDENATAAQAGAETDAQRELQTEAQIEAQRRTDEQLQRLKDQQDRVDEQLDRLIEMQRAIDRSRAPRPVTATSDRPADQGNAHVGPRYDTQAPAATRSDDPTYISANKGGADSTYTTVAPTRTNTYYVREAVPVAATGPVVYTTRTTYHRPSYVVYPSHRSVSYKSYSYGPGYHYYGHSHKYYGRYGSGLKLRVNTGNVGLYIGGHSGKYRNPYNYKCQ